MVKGTGVYEVEFTIARIVAPTRVCRVDIGCVMDTSVTERLGSGVRWLAADGDVFLAPDASPPIFLPRDRLPPNGDDGAPARSQGWLGNANIVNQGFLPRWDRDHSTVGLVLDSDRMELGFTMDGELLPFQVELSGAPVQFVVSWSSCTSAKVTLRTWRWHRWEDRGDLGRLVAALRRIDGGNNAIRQAVASYCRTAPRADLARGLAAAVQRVPMRQRRAVVKAFAEIYSRGALDPVGPDAINELLLFGDREVLAIELVKHSRNRERLMEAIVDTGGLTDDRVDVVERAALEEEAAEQPLARIGAALGAALAALLKSRSYRACCAWCSK